MENTKVISKQIFQAERSLYNLTNAVVSDCKFDGEEDGESPLKESRNIKVENSLFNLRYSFWHSHFAEVNDCKFTNLARAPFWYSEDLKLNRIDSEAVKIFRECKNIVIADSTFISEEPFWKCSNLTVKNSKLSGFYAFFGSEHVFVKGVKFTGKYSFQYINDLIIEDSDLDTKDAFWHCENVVVKNSRIKGEYIGWYSKNITFINCTIESHQPFCYSDNLVFKDCKMPNCDLAFEFSTVEGTIDGEIESIKNPKSCNLTVGKVKEVINDSTIHKVKINLITKE